jgi:hypothetical protein
MIDVFSYWMVIILAAGCSFIVLTRTFENQIVFSLLGLMLWIVAMFSSFSVSVVSEGANVEFSYPVLAIISFLAGCVMLVSVLQEAFNVDIVGGRF